jgi:hypothetical protein
VGTDGRGEAAKRHGQLGAFVGDLLIGIQGGIEAVEPVQARRDHPFQGLFPLFQIVQFGLAILETPPDGRFGPAADFGRDLGKLRLGAFQFGLELGGSFRPALGFVVIGRGHLDDALDQFGLGVQFRKGQVQQLLLAVRLALGIDTAVMFGLEPGLPFRYRFLHDPGRAFSIVLRVRPLLRGLPDFGAGFGIDLGKRNDL